MNAKPYDYDQIADICVVWWWSLQQRETPGGRHVSADKAALAQLRRIDIIDYGGAPAVDIGAALGIPAFRDFIRRMRGAQFRNSTIVRWLWDDRMTLEPFAIAASALAHTREDAGTGKLGATARFLGKPTKGEVGGNACFAEARFKRLIRTRNQDWPGLHLQARRIVAILGQKAPIGDLGASLILWNADPRIFKHWAFQYYQKDFEQAATEPETTVASTAPSA